MDKSIIDALLQICEPFLRKNDLGRMYGELEDMASPPRYKFLTDKYGYCQMDEDFVSDVTSVLIQCDIDVMEEFNKIGYIPSHAFRWLDEEDIPDSIIQKTGDDDTILTFKKYPGIKSIGYQSFKGTDFDIIDISGLEVIEGAFSYTNTANLIIDDNTLVNDGAFDYSEIETVYVPNSMTEDDVRKKLEGSGIDEGFNIRFQ